MDNPIFTKESLEQARITLSSSKAANGERIDSKYWHIVPRIVIDRSKYKGKGRPRNDDYKIDVGGDIPRHDFRKPYILGGNYIGIISSSGK